MNILWKTRESLFSAYCTDIKRRVFIIGKNHSAPAIYSSGTIDEFGLTFPQWELICEENDY